MKRVTRVVAGALAIAWAFSLAACEDEKVQAGTQTKTIVDLYTAIEKYGSNGVTVEFLQEALAEGEVAYAVLNANGFELYGNEDGQYLCFGEAGNCAHNFTGEALKQKADCTDFGYSTATCVTCRATKYAFTAANGHSWKVAQMISDDTARYVCETCGESLTTDYPLPDDDGGEEEKIDRTKDFIYVYNQTLAFDEGWIEEAVARFEEMYKDTSFSAGKVGVEVVVTRGKERPEMLLSPTSQYQLYFGESSSSVREFAQSGLLADITDVVTEPLSMHGEEQSIADKMYESNQATYCIDGKYYALPHYEAYSGLTYDVELFEEYGLFLADENVGDTYEYTFGSANFVSSDTDAKSCGSDGMYDTQDDGLPSSLTEFLILCAKMKEQGIVPLMYAGQYPQYANLLVDALWASLAGYEKMRTAYEYVGEIEVVAGFSDEPLFEGIDYVKTPITETVTITPENGYRVYDMVERYYATAIMQIAEKEGWFAQESYMNSSSFVEMQTEFLFNGEFNQSKVGMLIEGSWWYSEARDSVEDYYESTGNSERRVAWMSLPVQIFGNVSDGGGREQTLMNEVNSFAFINANVSDEGTLAACKYFLRFLYSQDELVRFTKTTGVAKGVSYELPDEAISHMDYFQRSLYAARRDARAVYASADNAIFLANQQQLRIGMSSSLYRPNGTWLCYALRNGMTAAEAFEATSISANVWLSQYYID